MTSNELAKDLKGYLREIKDSDSFVNGIMRILQNDNDRNIMLEYLYQEPNASERSVYILSLLIRRENSKYESK